MCAAPSYLTSFFLVSPEPLCPARELHFALAMRRAVLPFAIVLLLAPQASAQVISGPPPRIASPPDNIVAQTTFDTSYLLSRYMTELAAAGVAPTQADIDEAARQYFTNGAEVTGVPATGPGAAYFRNGAEVTGVPSSGPGAAYFRNGAEVFAYPAPRSVPAPEATGQPGAVLAASESNGEDAGMLRDAAGSEDAGAPAIGAAPTSVAEAGASAAPAVSCPPSEIEAAMAIARQFATATLPPQATTSWAPPTAPTNEATPPWTPSCAVQPPSECLPRPSFWSRVGLALGGAFLGGLAVALWSRPRRSV
jgi:hypothetical protein